MLVIRFFVFSRVVSFQSFDRTAIKDLSTVLYNTLGFVEPEIIIHMSSIWYDISIWKKLYGRSSVLTPKYIVS